MALMSTSFTALKFFSFAPGVFRDSTKIYRVTIESPQASLAFPPSLADPLTRFRSTLLDMAAETAAAGAGHPESTTRLARTRANAAYLLNPKAAAAPAGFFTRSGLRTTRYVLKFVFWRLVRYAKYAIIGAGTAALAGTFIGTALPWVGAILVPSMPVAALMGATTALIKFTWRHRGNHFRQGWLVAGEGRDARKDEQRDAAGANQQLHEVLNRRQRRAEHTFSTEAL
ncbi:hypothetical protein JCM11251_007170 [Rhodosporidiobolus azoricus]